MFTTLNNNKTPWWLLMLGTAALLTACGGGSDAPMPATAPAQMEGRGLPVAAQHSSTGVADFARTRLPATSETSEPLPLRNTQLATDDFAEPSAM